MKIFRTDLQVGLKNKLFEIPGASLKMDDIVFLKQNISSVIHSEHAPNGYYLSIQLDALTREVCDRCLSGFDRQSNISFTILLTSNLDLIDKDDHDVIFYNNQNEYIDITSILSEHIFLERPLKFICADNCQGLCSICGCNLNEQQCECKIQNEHMRWEALNKIN